MATTKKTAAKETAAKKPAAKKPAAKKPAVKKTVKKVEPQNQHIGLVRDDSWLEPFEDAIRGRHDHALWKIGQLTRNGKSNFPTLLPDISILDFTSWLRVGCSASGHLMQLISIW